MTEQSQQQPERNKPEQVAPAQVAPEQDKPESKSLWSRVGPKTRSVLSGLAAVVLLAIVITGVSALSAPKSTRPLNTQLDQGPADTLYDEALTALASGDTTKAIGLLEQVVATDPSNQQAQRTLDSARATASGSSTNDTDDSNDTEDTDDADQTDPNPDPDDTTPPVADDPAFGKPTDNLAVWLPSSAEGYDLGTSSVVGDDTTLAGTRSDPNLVGTRAVWAVHYRDSEAKAKEFVEKVSKSLYAKDAKSVPVDGATAYFGTDGSRFATVVYVRGRYVFEVVLTTLDGKPAALSGEAQGAAKAFPDAP